MSPSTRRAWIEIAKYRLEHPTDPVALHPEGVDRNLGAFAMQEAPMEVALHPEGVDRNTICATIPLPSCVALHPEGVDRNIDCARFK